MRKNNTLFVLVGPTASGKTDAAIELARSVGGEIVCADSRTIYRGLDSCTAKPSPEERATVPHYGLDLINPDERFSAADFKVYALRTIEDIRARGKVPILVGGTGLYIDSVVFDYEFGPPADEVLRAELEAKDVPTLQKMLQERGIELPENAQNKRYLIRAMEQGGVNTSRRNEPVDGAFLLGLMPPEAELKERIAKRAKIMRENGGVDEVARVLDTYGPDAPALSMPFCKAYLPHVTAGVSLAQCEQHDIRLTWQLARRQRTWFKRNRYIHWFEDPAALQEFVRAKNTTT